MLKKAGKVIFHYDNITKEGRGAGNDQLLQRQKKEWGKGQNERS